MKSPTASLARTLAATSLIAIVLFLVLARGGGSIAPVRSSEIDMDEPAASTGHLRDGHSNERSPD